VKTSYYEVRRVNCNDKVDAVFTRFADSRRHARDFGSLVTMFGVSERRIVKVTTEDVPLKRKAKRGSK